MIKLIASIVAILGMVGKWFMERFSAKAKARKEAVEHGKKAVDDNDISGITSSFDKLR